MPTELLFSYGTLQKREIQITHFGRELTGRADTLPGYRRRMLTVTEPSVIELTGETQTPTAEPSSGAGDSIAGVVFEITPDELAAVDKYEHAARYRRLRVTLSSGAEAWLYVHSTP